MRRRRSPAIAAPRAAEAPGRRRCSTSDTARHHRLGRRSKRRQAGRPPARKAERRSAPDAAEGRDAGSGRDHGRARQDRFARRARDAGTPAGAPRRSSKRAARELDMRESLLKAAEKRIEAEVAELKDLEARVKAALPASSDKAEAAALQEPRHHVREHEAEGRRQDFDRLDMKVLVEVATPDESAPHVGNPGADDAGSGRAADRRARQPLPRAKPAPPTPDRDAEQSSGKPEPAT